MKPWGVVVIAACTQSSTMTIRGTSTDTFITPTGDVTHAHELATTTFQAFVLGNDGTYAAYPDVATLGTVGGAFEIADVPDGPYLLLVGSNDWLTESSPNLAWTNTYVGRSDAVPATEATWLGLSGSGLAAWDPNDELLGDCWGNGTELALSRLLSIGSGATSFDGTAEWADPPISVYAYSFEPTGQPYLMNADQGDSLVVSRDTASSIGPTTTARTLTQIMNAPGVDQIDGGSAMTGASFVDVPMTSQIELAIDPSEFVAAFGSGSASYSMTVIATPGQSDEGLIGPSLVEVDGGSDGVDVTLPYGNPFDPSWPVFISARYDQTDRLASNELVPASASYTFHPAAIATGFALDDTPLDQGDVAWDGSSPLPFTLVLPDGATGFELTLSDALSPFVGAFFDVTGSSVVIPPQLFVAGHSYSIEVYTQTATAGAGVSVGPFVVGSAQPK
ncbi:MAG TPA: hypothetical protein VGG28_04780 [Kofleriaceae bacterium]